jgi:hypothetical protein
MFIKNIFSFFKKQTFKEFVDKTLNEDKGRYCFIGYDGFQDNFFTVASARSFRSLWSHGQNRPYGMTKADVDFCIFLWEKHPRYFEYKYLVTPYYVTPEILPA